MTAMTGPNVLRTHGLCEVTVRTCHGPPTRRLGLLLERQYASVSDVLYASGPAHSNRVEVPMRGLISVLAQAYAGLASLHNAGVVHGDIRLPNILVSGPLDNVGRSRAVVADLGMALSAEGSPGRPFLLGRTHAPEVLTQLDCVMRGSLAADVYMLGAHPFPQRANSLVHVKPESPTTPLCAAANAYEALTGVLLYQLEDVAWRNEAVSMRRAQLDASAAGCWPALDTSRSWFPLVGMPEPEHTAGAPTHEGWQAARDAVETLTLLLQQCLALYPGERPDAGTCAQVLAGIASDTRLDTWAFRATQARSREDCKRLIRDAYGKLPSEQCVDLVREIAQLRGQQLEPPRHREPSKHSDAGVDASAELHALGADLLGILDGSADAGAPPQAPPDRLVSHPLHGLEPDACTSTPDEPSQVRCHCVSGVRSPQGGYMHVRNSRLGCEHSQTDNQLALIHRLLATDAEGRAARKDGERCRTQHGQGGAATCLASYPRHQGGVSAPSGAWCQRRGLACNTLAIFPAKSWPIIVVHKSR